MASGLAIIDARDASQVRAVADAAVRERMGSCARVARLCRDGAAAARELRRLADAGTPEVGVDCTTVERWGLGRWELYGDGRRPATAAERRAAALAALARRPKGTLASGLPGMASLLCRVERAASGSAAMRPGAPAPAGLTEAERELLEACRDYEALLAGQGIIEPGEALALLPEAMGGAGWAHLVLVAPRSLTDAQVSLVAAAAAREGATLVAELGGNAACEASRRLAERLEAACRAAGAEVARVRSEEPAPSPWRSTEVAALAGSLFAPRAGSPVLPRGDVRFCLPSGRYAEPELVAREVERAVAAGAQPRDVAVACKDPLAWAEAASGRLAEAPGRPIACLASGQVPLAGTLVGRALAGLAALVQAERARGGAPDPSLSATASDVARNPLAAIPVREALELDRAWRGDRSAGATRLLDDLAAASAKAAEEEGAAAPAKAAEEEEGAAASARAAEEGAPLPTGSAAGAPEGAPLPTGTAAGRGGALPGGALPGQGASPARAPLAEAVAAMRAQDLAAAARALAAPLGSRGADERLERAAAAKAAALAEAARAFGLPFGEGPGSVERLFSGAGVQAFWASVPAEDALAARQALGMETRPNAVEFCTLPQLEGRSFSTVVVCGLTAESLSVADRSDACSSFLAHLGVDAGPTALQEARRQMRSALEAARDSLVLERCLQDPEGKALRPSAMLEEAVDCYRADPSASGDLDRVTGMPKDGRLPCDTLGEERFSELASPASFAPAVLKAASTGVLLPVDVARSLAPGGTAWSPAALELYLSCPLRWFYERRLPMGGVDASFGPREMGAFSRRVLRSFHERMAGRGVPRVAGSADEGEWGPVLDACFQEELRDQDGAESPLIAVTPLQREQLETVRRDLHGCVERDALLPAGFSTGLLEWQFGDKEPVRYGGVLLRGTVHRVDMDASGRALVVDYKGAFGEGYGVPQPKRGQAEEDVDRLPRHSQALMYASALQRALPGTVAAGALYVSYNRARAAGFLDQTVVGLAPAEEPYLGPKSMVPPGPDGASGFQALLALVEDEASAAMARLRDGDVYPRPRFGKDSCAYCTVKGCPRRLGR